MCLTSGDLRQDPIRIKKCGLEKLIEEVRTGLEKESFVILYDALPEAICASVRAEIQDLQKSGGFIPAKIGKGEFHQLNEEIRGDGTQWFQPDNLSSVQAVLWQKLQLVREGLNARLFLGLWDMEGHYAVYSPGKFYRKHLDRFQNDSKRVLSVVLFFNEDWTVEDGGILRMETPVGIREVMPKSGTAVFFFSDLIPHEVTETRRERFSFAGWFKTR